MVLFSLILIDPKPLHFLHLRRFSYLRKRLGLRFQIWYCRVNKMQSETADFASGAATWRTGQNTCVVFDSGLHYMKTWGHPQNRKYILHNVSHCCQSRTDHFHFGGKRGAAHSDTENLLKFRREIRKWTNRQTSRQTDRQTDTLTGGDVIFVIVTLYSIERVESVVEVGGDYQQVRVRCYEDKACQTASSSVRRSKLIRSLKRHCSHGQPSIACTANSQPRISHNVTPSIHDSRHP